MSGPNQEDTQFQVLRLLEQQQDLSQRKISETLGVSLGGVNYCLKALVAKDHVKIQNFRSSSNKVRYAYMLTPAGIALRSKMTSRFLKKKMEEYEMRRLEMEGLEHEVLHDETT